MNSPLPFSTSWPMALSTGAEAAIAVVAILIIGGLLWVSFIWAFKRRENDTYAVSTGAVPASARQQERGQRPQAEKAQTARVET